MRYRFIALFIVLYGFCSCDKNTNQLPPISAPALVYTRNCVLNGTDKIQVVFSQNSIGKTDSIYVWLKNLSSDSFANVSVLVELCKAVPNNYDNCNLQYVLSVDSLKQGDTAGRQLLFVNTGAPLDVAKINVGILSYTGSALPIAGQHANAGNLAAIQTKDSNYYYASFNGYVFADGMTTFRFRWKDSTYYNLSGQFTANSVFTGKLYDAAKLLTPVFTSTVQGGKPDTLTISGFGNSAADSITSITLYLK